MGKEDTATIGFIRFSTLTSQNLNNWNMTRRSSLEKAREVLFDEKRLEKRFALFEALTLPYIASDYSDVGEDDFVVVLTSRLMPKKFLDRLYDDVAGVPAIKVVEMDVEDTVANVCGAFVQGRDGSGGGVAVTYRLDDDDALYHGHVSQLRAEAKAENEAHVVSHRKGAFVRFDKDANVFLAADVNYTDNSCGIAYVSRLGGAETIFSKGAHHKLTSENKSVVLERKRSWIRSIYDESDTGHVVRKNSFVPMDTEAFKAWLGPEYGYLDLGKVAAAYAL